jgi:hypothetical protein
MISNLQIFPPRKGGPGFRVFSRATLFAAVLCLGAHLGHAQTAAVVQANDGKLAVYSQASADIFTQTLLSGYSGNHTIYWGALWGSSSAPLAVPQVEPVPPTDFYNSSSYVPSEWSVGSNLLGEAHASRLELMVMESSLQSIQSSLSSLSSESTTEENTLSGIESSDASGPTVSSTFNSITVTGTTTWGTVWSSQTVPWTEWDSQNLAGCYQTELWIFGAILMLPIILKVKPD